MKQSRRSFIQISGIALSAKLIQPNTFNSAQLKTNGWKTLQMENRPALRWWWPGNAVSKTGIAGELQAIISAGFGRVEIQTGEATFEKGNALFLSNDHLGSINEALEIARKSNLKVSLSLSLNGTLSGNWVAPDDRSRCLTAEWHDVAAGMPIPLINTGKSDSKKLLAIVAAKWDGKSLDLSTAKIIQPAAALNASNWQNDGSQWRVFHFYLQPTNQSAFAETVPAPYWVIDHLNRTAVQNFINKVGQSLRQRLRKHLVATLDKCTVDVSGVVAPHNCYLWSEETLALFQTAKGYDLTAFLPCLWIDCGPTTNRVRYDVKDFLETLRDEIIKSEIQSWCEANGLQLERNTSGQTKALQTTRINDSPFLTRPIELKHILDLSLIEGSLQPLVNDWEYHEAQPLIQHRVLSSTHSVLGQQPWFKHFREMADYAARCSWMLAQGQPVKEVAIYQNAETSPEKNSSLQRQLRLLGYSGFPISDKQLAKDIKPVKPDVLAVATQQAQVCIFPESPSVSLAAMQRLNTFVQAGGQLIFIGRAAEQSSGLFEASKRDAEIQQIKSALLAKHKSSIHLLPAAADWQSPTFNVLLAEALHAGFRPDVLFTSDEDDKHGFRFSHTRTDDKDIYFLANLQPQKIRGEITIRAFSNHIELWDPYTGEIRALPEYRSQPTRTEIPITLDAWDSLFLVFHRQGTTAHVILTDVPDMAYVTERFALGYSDRAGEHSVQIAQQLNRRTLRAFAAELPAAITLKGPWKLAVSGTNNHFCQKTLSQLETWTGSTECKQLSGVGVYELNFDLSPEMLSDRVRWLLDLGQVGEVAEVTMNNKRIGVRWLPPFVFDVTREIKPEKNFLKIEVTNTLENYAQSAEALSVNEKLKRRYGNYLNGDLSGASHSAENRLNVELPPSGLLGVVRLIPQAILAFRF